MDLLFPILGLIFIAIFLALLFGKAEQLPYFKQDSLLTPAELIFYKALKKTLDQDIAIAPKVRLADIVTCTPRDWSRGYGTKIASKHIDFTLYNKNSGEILCAIELDDKSHALAHRRRRDKFVNDVLKQTDLPLIRFPVSQKYYQRDLKSTLVKALKNKIQF